MAAKTTKKTSPAASAEPKTARKKPVADAKAASDKAATTAKAKPAKVAAVTSGNTKTKDSAAKAAPVKSVPAKPAAKQAKVPAAKPAPAKTVKTAPAKAEKPVAKPAKSAPAKAAKPEKPTPVKASKSAAKASKVEAAPVRSGKASKVEAAPVRSGKAKAAPAKGKPDAVPEHKKSGKKTAEPLVEAKPVRSKGAAASKQTAAVALAAGKIAKKPTRRGAKADTEQADGVDGEAKKKRKYTRRIKKAPAPVPKYQGKQVTLLKKKGTTDAPAAGTRQQRLYSPQDLEYFRLLILDKIKDANEELLSIEDRLMDSASGEYNEDSTYSLHMADQGTDAMEREKAYLFAARERKFISHLTDALQRIKSGNYGICIVCGDLIEKGRLEAVPHARMCISCKQETKVR